MAQRARRAKIEARFAKANTVTDETLSLAKEKMGTAIGRRAIGFVS